MGRNLVETLMGAVVLVVAGLFLAFAYSVTNVRTNGGYELEARFDRIDGLAVGADVRIAGIRVGSVMRMDAGRAAKSRRIAAHEIDRGARARDGTAGDDHPRDACVGRASDHVAAVLVEAVVRQVDADVDQFQGLLTSCRRAAVVRLRAGAPGLQSSPSLGSATPSRAAAASRGTPIVTLRRSGSR